MKKSYKYYDFINNSVNYLVLNYILNVIYLQYLLQE